MATEVVPVGLDKTDSVDAGGSYRSVFVAFPGSEPVVNEHAHTWVSRRRIRGPLQTSPLVNGWRAPKPYVSAAARRTSEAFFLVNVNPIKGPGALDYVEGMSRPISGTLYGYCPPDSLFFDGQGRPYVNANTIVRAETEAMEKLKSSKVNLGTMLGEARSTIDSIARIALVLSQLYFAVQKHDWKAAGQIIGDAFTPTSAADAWLAYAFFVRPLMADIYGLNESLKRGIRPEGLIIHVERTVRANVTPIFLKSGNWVDFNYTGKVEELAKCILYAKIDAKWSSNLSSLGLINPYSVAWELVGWSFLLDYLMPISTWLSALDASAGISFLSGTLTKRVHADMKFKVLPRSSIATFAGDWCSTRYQCLAMQRTVYDKFPTPWVFIKSPFSTAHFANVAALIAANIGRG